MGALKIYTVFLSTGLIFELTLALLKKVITFS